jgi:co-chaperonin GroES (HSP10)
MSEGTFPIQPLFDNVFVKKDAADKTDSGIHLPQSVKGRAVTGTVIAVGPGHLCVETGKFSGCTVKVGDTVLLREFSGSPINLARLPEKYKDAYKNLEVFCFREGEILGVMRE